MRNPAIATLALVASVLVLPATVRAGSFDFVPATAAGPSGAVAMPDLVVRFTGDGIAIDSQADFSFDAARLELLPTGIAGGLCTIIGGNRMRVIAPLRLSPFPESPTAFCSVRVNIRAGASPSSAPITPVPGSAICATSSGIEFPCTATGATVSIGPALGSARIDYTPAPGSTVLASAQGVRIAAQFVPGSPGDSITVTQCTIAGDPVFEPVTTAPSPLTFAGTASVGGGIDVRCVAPAAAGVGQLTCQQAINGGTSAPLSWTINCPSSLVAPSVSYLPSFGTTVEVRSLNVIGSVDTRVINAQIAGDGAGSGAGATTTVRNCATTGAFIATLPGGSIGAVGNAGASGAIALSCVAEEQPQVGTLSCLEDRGGMVATRDWALLCPAGRPDVVFVGGFD